MEDSTHGVGTLNQHILNHIWQCIVAAKTDNLETSDCGSPIQKKSLCKKNSIKKEVSSRNSNNDRPQEDGASSDNHSTSATDTILNRMPIKDATEDSKTSTCNIKKHECDDGLTAKCINMCNCVQRLFTAATRKLSKKRRKYRSSLKEEEKDENIKEDSRPLASLNVNKIITLNDCLSVGLNPPYLEKCLNDAIATVLLSLPEDYDLVEHSSSLFVFLLEVISSSPVRPCTQKCSFGNIKCTHHQTMC
ncbi:unnamed protein product [Meganyctiphanes norvegica]|uniref:Uncharacterized protein n=1 Tax=Meganyctiphanes norvegica TaxID=48144 RepID=A0AAV2R981_MEGNR